MTFIKPLVLCGGAGSRLWPTSRNSLPKQFAILFGQRSTFQETVLRTYKYGLSKPLVLTNQEHRFIAQQQLENISLEADIWTEPTRRDSGPAIAAGCTIIARDDPDALVLVLASDHVMRDPAAFHRAVMQGAAAAAAGHLVTFGVTPSHPETGYGYIEAGEVIFPDVAMVKKFAEKPTAERALEYVATGMLWNSGNFLFHAKTLLAEYDRVDPETVAIINEAVHTCRCDGRSTAFGACYEQARPSSIDFAVMEKTRRAAVVPVSCGWSDIGSWDALWGFNSPDQSGNVINGAVELVDSVNCFVTSSGPLTSLVGLRDVIVVVNDDAVLVSQKNRSADVKTLVDQMRKNGRSEADNHSRVHRPWGWYEVMDAGDRFQVKRIVVNPGGRLSLQKHQHRSEHWVVVNGLATVTVDDRVEQLQPNQHAYIPLGALHRLENLGNVPVELVEVQTGTYLGEDDILRVEDVYNRV
jgi:mannose-1-phosphate guanylyltransferase/mannose-6-phosphate isomerase